MFAAELISFYIFLAHVPSFQEMALPSQQYHFYLMI